VSRRPPRAAEARLEAEIAIADTERVDLTHAGPAWYELGELRLRVGELAEAAEAFRRAHELGFAPQPGLTFLLLEQGDVGAASASIETALASIPGHALSRARLLPARVKVMTRRSSRGAAGNTTDREVGVVAAVLVAGSEKAAAHRLGLSHSTVKHHLANARSKVGAETTNRPACR
jgi:DNA-binding CsgD family transcriptional regulator